MMHASERRLMPPRVFREILDATEEDALFTCDAGENRLFMTHFFQTKAPDSLLMPGIVAGIVARRSPSTRPAAMIWKLHRVGIPQHVVKENNTAHSNKLDGLFQIISKTVVIRPTRHLSTAPSGPLQGRDVA